MENLTDGDQARRSLELLATTRRATEVEATLPATPGWYGVAVANAVAGFNLGNHHWGWVGFAVASTAVMMTHYIRTMRVFPKWSARTIVTSVLAAAVVWVLFAAWGALSSTDLTTVRLTLLAWMLTTLCLVSAISLMNRWRDRLLIR